MKRPLIVLLMTLLWLAVTGSVTLLNCLLGLAVSAASLWLVRLQMDTVRVKVRPLRLLLLGGLFFKELALSVIKVAILVVQPKMQLKPGIFAFPLERDPGFRDYPACQSDHADAGHAVGRGLRRPEHALCACARLLRSGGCETRYRQRF